AFGIADILGLQIAMYDAVYMSKIEGSCQIMNDMQRLFEWNPCSASNQVTERFAFDVFEDGIRLIAVKTEIIDGRNTLVIQICAQLRFTLQKNFQIDFAADARMGNNLHRHRTI